MEQFLDGAHVRLRSRAHGGGYVYLHADEDGVGVSLRGHRGTLRVAWRVHRVQLHGGGGATRVLLHGAAYGRYLAVRPVTVLVPGLGALRVYRPVQCVYNDPEQEDVLWEAIDAGDGSGGDVLMRHHRYGVWYDLDDLSTARRWVIEPIPRRPEPPSLPLPGLCAGGSRMIRYVLADDEGNFTQLGWREFHFYGQSVFRLMAEVVSPLLAEQFDIIGITLCVRAGLCGRLTPLVIDLPFNQEPMDIIVLATGSPAAEALVYPDVDA